MLGKSREAKKYIKEAHDLNKNNDKGALEYAKSLYEEGAHLLSLEILEGILMRNPSYKLAKYLKK